MADKVHKVRTTCQPVECINTMNSYAAESDPILNARVSSFPSLPSPFNNRELELYHCMSSASRHQSGVPGASSGLTNTTTNELDENRTQKVIETNNFPI